MRRCWVIDHPAHARLLAPLMRAISTPDDLIIATQRIEVQKMLEESDGYLPRRKMVWVPRPVGKNRVKKAFQRRKISKRALKNIQQVISIGAPIEIRVAPKKSQRIYITDTEVNHLAHRLVRKRATDIIVPIHFIDQISGKLLHTPAKIHRIEGLHGHVHLSPLVRSEKVSNPPNILVRRLKGNGIHDDSEVLNFQEEWLDGFKLTLADEDSYEGSSWELDKVVASMDGVITQSVTLASESVLLGVPCLLISRAERGFLDYLESQNYPLFRMKVLNYTVFEEFRESINTYDKLHVTDWPDTQKQLLKILQNN